ncbi:MAG: ABC transporter ATP-binding protein [Candidatus Wallbacteria bacterium]|nr:ABC transporter ATP-binding protein [Candidatus Wallbacteria bacterium]
MTEAVPMIRTEHLRKEFHGHVALENLNLEVARGDVYGLIGPNGAGKTTLLRILATLERPTYGRVSIDGLDLETHPKEVHRRIGWMPDFQHAFEEMTVRDYLEYFARAYKLPADVRRKRLQHLLELTQLEVKAGDPVGNLSRGMKQRLSLGRTLMNDPALLLLDEPTSGLDPKARIDFRGIVKSLAAEGKTVLISSHILEDLSDFCNSVGILEKGRMVESGRIASIVARMKAATQLRVRVLAGLDRAAALVRECPHTVSLQVAGEWIEVTFSGGASEQADLLAGLSAAGVRMAAFEERRAGLEEIFLRGSSGEVS